MEKQVLYSVIFYSIIGAGGVYMGINPSSQYAELEHFLELSTPKLIITAPAGLGVLQEVTKAKGIPQSRICVLDNYAVSFISDILSSDPARSDFEFLFFLFLHMVVWNK